MNNAARVAALFFFAKPRPRKRRKTISVHDRSLARAIVLERIEHFNRFYQFPYNKVFIKNQRSRWGSCSSKKNLNFNYRIITLAPALQDYLVVHELCHLRELNHGKAFWELVALQIPDYRTRAYQLRRHPL